MGIIGTGAGVVNADRLYVTAMPTQGGNTYLNLYHVEGDTEGEDNHDAPALFSMINARFYSKNPLVLPDKPAELGRDARGLDSMSTYTCPFEGVDITEPSCPTALTFENKNGTYQGNNVLAFFYDNAKDPADPNFSTDPNWVYSGITLDAQEAGKTPATSYVTVPVQNGLSNIMQVKYFPPEDVNFDGNVNMADFAALAAYWGVTFKEGIYPRTAYSPTDTPQVYTDINNNGTVDLEDLVRLSGKWMFEKPAYEIDAYDPINPPLE